MAIDATLAARAFNLGSDARIAGQGRAACPYVAVDGSDLLRRLWAEGWRDVDMFWGRLAGRPVPPLPEVKEERRGRRA